MDVDFILFLLFRAKQFLFLFSLFIASLHDLKTKRVPNRLWLFLLFFLFPILFLEFVFIGYVFLFQILISFVIFFILLFFAFSMKFFGGADCKAFLFIAIGFSSSNLILIPIRVLIYSLMISVFFIFLLFFKNGIVFFKSRKKEIRFQTFLSQFLIQKIPFLPSITIGFCLFSFDFHFFNF